VSLKIELSEFDPETFLFCIDHPKGRMGKVGDRYGLVDWDKGLDKFQLDRGKAFSMLFGEYMIIRLFADKYQLFDNLQ
jgi:hypothetical protein